MKILHLTAMSTLSPNSGVPAVLKCLTDEQNKIEGVEARVLALCSTVDMIGSPFFDSLGTMVIDEYVNNFKPDLAIFHSFFHIEYASVAKVLTKMNIPFFIEPHGSFGHSAMKKGWIKKWVANNTIFRSLIMDATAYIFTNVAEEQDSVYIPNQSCVIPNGIIESIAKESADKKDNLLKNPIFYFLGRFDIHHKGLDFLFDALQILDKNKYDLTMRLYGAGNKKQTKYVENRISNFTHIDVKNMGTIYGDKKKEKLEDANILVLTSRYEGSPMTILDGLCYGNPCLVTLGTNVANEVVDNKLGWKTDLNAFAIADGIIKAKEDYNISGTDYVKRCKKYVLNNYSWTKISAESIQKYIRLVGK